MTPDTGKFNSLEDRLNRLPADADRALAGLQAQQRLKLKIEKAAAQPSEHKTALRGAYRWAPALGLALVLVIGAAFSLPALLEPDAPQQLITTHALGSENTIAGELALLDLNNDNISISRRSGTPSYRSIWEKGSNGNFPLIALEGRYYRMLTSPASVSQSLLGSALGSVQEFTTEPSLSRSDVILSNQAAIGTPVYAVKNMSGTLVAAEVNGALRLFQRVGYNGSALKGRESLEDTLQISGRITAMELSEVGVITDAGVCNSLFQLLLNTACYESSGSVSAKQSLLIELDNGLIVQLAVKNETFAACGTWSCPDFFEAFRDAVQ